MVYYVCTKVVCFNNYDMLHMKVYILNLTFLNIVYACLPIQEKLDSVIKNKTGHLLKITKNKKLHKT